MADHRHVVIGFQSSGKTTYAAALWHLVDSRDTPTVLTKGLHNGDYRYLEKIASAWEQGWQVDHTAFGTWQPITINLRSEAGGDEVMLSFVDMSGETFERVFATREFDEHVEGMARDCEGLLLFVTALRLVDDVSIVDVGMAFPDEMPDEVDEVEDDDAAQLSQTAIGQNADAQCTEASPKSATTVESQGPDEFTPSRTPRQVQMTDLLDAFSEEPIALSPVRVVVIVSAWDKAPKNMTPDRWLAERMPLLDQYLRTHGDEFETRVYGVSAQGGVLPTKDKPHEPSDRQALLAERIASQRIRVVGHDASQHDLTHPIAWLSGLER